MRISTAEMRREFGRVREAALKSPVVITNHGRDSLVLMAADEYERLKALDTRRAWHVSELTEAETALLSKIDIPPESEEAQAALDAEVK